MPFTNTLKGTLEALNALKAALEALEWTPPNPPGGAAQPAFDKVELFDMSDIATALQELLAFKNRVCLVVHDAEDFHGSQDGQRLRHRPTIDVALIFTDRNYKKRQLAMTGDLTATPPTPGVFALKDVIVAGAGGLLLPGVTCTFLRGEFLPIEGKVRDELTGRIAFVLTLRLTGGEIVFDTGRAPIPKPT